MPAKPSAVGLVYGPYEEYDVSRTKIREFADAVDARAPEHRDVEAARAAGFADLVAPTTFAVLIAQRIEFRIVVYPEVGVIFDNVVHADQRFIHHRPIVAGDVISTVLTVESITKRAGISTMTTRTELIDASGAPVSSVISSLVEREDA